MPTLFTMNADVQDFMSPAFRGAAGTQIHFDLNITPGALLKVDDLERPTMALYHRAVGYIRSDGRMYDREPVSAAPYDLEDPGTLGVRLLADDPDLNLSGPVTYRVSGFRYLDGRKVGFGPYETTTVPSTDEVVDLADFLVPPADLVANTSDALIQDAVDEYVNANLFSTYAVQVNPSDPNSLWQWQNIDGDPIGDPVPFPDIINVAWSAVSDKPAFLAAGDTAEDARNAIGAGTSNLTLGTTAGTAKAGDYQPASTDITDATVIGRSLVTATDAAAARTTIGVSLVDLNEVSWYDNTAAFPAAGAADVVYGARDTGQLFLWAATQYVATRSSVTAADITDAGTTGRAVVQADTEAEARLAAGAAPADAGNPTAGEPVQPRRGTAAEWTAANPVLAEGEEGLETDTDQSKRGDGVTAWTALPYVGKWDSIPGKPAVVAEGATQAAARAAIGAGDAQRTDEAWNYAQDGTTVGEAVRTAVDATAARAAIGAGTSNLEIGTTSSTAKAGNYQPTKADVGLVNVDNTADANKPISTAQRAEIATMGLVSRMTVWPSAGRRNTIRTLIQDLVTSGVWGKLDGLYILAAHDIQAARLNWVGATMQDLTSVNSPAFQIDRGFTGDGSAAYLDTNTFGDALNNYAANDATMMVYNRSNIASNTAMDVGKVGAYINPSTTGNMVTARANTTGGSAASIANGGARTGLFAWTRDATDVHVYRNGALLGSAAAAGGSLTSPPFTILKVDTSYSTRQIAAAAFAKGLSAAEHVSFNNALTTYLTAIGANA